MKNLKFSVKILKFKKSKFNIPKQCNILAFLFDLTCESGTYIYHFHTLLQREEKVHKCHIGLLSVLRNAITKNGGSIYNIYSLLGGSIPYSGF